MGSVRKEVCCDICGVSISRRSFARHRLQHLGGKDDLKWRCSSNGCDYGDLQRCNVVQHYLQKHSGLRLYVCPYQDESGDGQPCPFTSATASGWYRHRRIVHRGLTNRRDKDEMTTPLYIQEHWPEWVIPPRIWQLDQAARAALFAPPGPETQQIEAAPQYFKFNSGSPLQESARPSVVYTPAAADRSMSEDNFCSPAGVFSPPTMRTDPRERPSLPRYDLERGAEGSRPVPYSDTAQRSSTQSVSAVHPYPEVTNTWSLTGAFALRRVV